MFFDLKKEINIMATSQSLPVEGILPALWDTAVAGLPKNNVGFSDALFEKQWNIALHLGPRAERISSLGCVFLFSPAVYHKNFT